MYLEWTSCLLSQMNFFRSIFKTDKFVSSYKVLTPLTFDFCSGLTGPRADRNDDSFKDVSERTPNSVLGLSGRDVCLLRRWEENWEGFFLCREDWELLIEDTVTSKGRNFHLLLLWVQLQSLAVVIPFQICKLSRSSGTCIWAIGVPPLPFFLLYTAPQSNLSLWKVVSRKVWGRRT